MLNHRPEDIYTASTKEFVTTTFRYLGKVSHTPGHWKHRLNAWQYSILPEWLRMHLLTIRAKGLNK